jgi:hypothetical protein
MLTEELAAKKRRRVYIDKQTGLEAGPHILHTAAPRDSGKSPPVHAIKWSEAPKHIRDHVAANGYPKIRRQVREHKAKGHDYYILSNQDLSNHNARVIEAQAIPSGKVNGTRVGIQRDAKQHHERADKIVATVEESRFRPFWIYNAINERNKRRQRKEAQPLFHASSVAGKGADISSILLSKRRAV